jgi:Second Messenger Oligonucleotide or Dinucleotide Synthetase domain
VIVWGFDHLNEEVVMGYVQETLDEIQAKIAADPAVLAEARKRRDVVARAVERAVKGALRSFRSGSVAHGTVNRPVTDADGGVVLDRTKYPALGPDGSGDGPNDIVDEICDDVGSDIRKEHAKAEVKQSRRGVLVEFNEPCNSEEDPTVDHIVTLTRKDAGGLWIPDLEKDRWTPSHPEKHTELFTSGSREKRRLRARVTRLAKAWNKQWDENDRALSSFNVEALAWEFVQDETMPVDAVLTGWFAYAAAEIRKGETKDPAGVSEPIRLPLGQEVAVQRLSHAAANMAHAMEHDEDEDTVKNDLSRVFWKYVKPAESSAKDEFAAVLRGGNDGIRVTKTGVGLGAGTAMKTTRSFGGDDA